MSINNMNVINMTEKSVTGAYMAGECSMAAGCVAEGKCVAEECVAAGICVTGAYMAKEYMTGRIPVVSSLTQNDWIAIKEAFMKQVSYWADIMGISYGRITIRNQKTRWGSCSSKGNLNFNYRLYFMPEPLMNYVIIHELAHRVHMNHAKEFWSLVEKYCPDYKHCRQELKRYSLSLERTDGKFQLQSDGKFQLQSDGKFQLQSDGSFQLQSDGK